MRMSSPARTTVRDCWNGEWNLILVGALSTRGWKIFCACKGPWSIADPHLDGKMAGFGKGRPSDRGMYEKIRSWPIVLIWGTQKIPWADISSEETFWGLLRAGPSKTVTEQGRPFVVTLLCGCICVRSSSRGRWLRLMGQYKMRRALFLVDSGRGNGWVKIGHYKIGFAFKILLIHQLNQ